MICYLSGNYPDQPVVSATGHHVGDVDQSLGWMRDNKVIYPAASWWTMLVPHVTIPSHTNVCEGRTAAVNCDALRSNPAGVIFGKNKIIHNPNSQMSEIQTSSSSLKQELFNELLSLFWSFQSHHLIFIGRGNFSRLNALRT